MCLCQTLGRRRPLITGRSVNTAARGPALDAISICAAVVYVPLLLCAGWRQHTDCDVPPLLLKTGTTPLNLARPRKQGRQSALYS